MWKRWRWHQFFPIFFSRQNVKFRSNNSSYYLLIDLSYHIKKGFLSYLVYCCFYDVSLQDASMTLSIEEEKTGFSEKKFTVQTSESDRIDRRSSLYKTHSNIYRKNFCCSRLIAVFIRIGVRGTSVMTLSKRQKNPICESKLDRRS